MKKRVVCVIRTIDGTYRVEKNINTIEPKVGSILSTNQLEEFMTDFTLEVHIKYLKN